MEGLDCAYGFSNSILDLLVCSKQLNMKGKIRSKTFQEDLVNLVELCIPVLESYQNSIVDFDPSTGIVEMLAVFGPSPFLNTEVTC